MVGRNILGLQPVGECLLEKISALLCFLYNVYSTVYLFISEMFIYVCMPVGYFLCMERCSFLGWFNMFLLITCVESMFLYFKEWNINS
jgi:hypothetical protein